MMRVLAIVLLLCICPALLAQRHDARARDITSGSEYRGYRVEKPPVSEGSGGGSEANNDAGESGGEDSGTDENGYRRGTGAQGTPQRGGSAGPSDGGGRGGGSGGGLNFPEWIGTMFQVIAWVVVIGAAVIALFFIIKALLGINWKRKKKSKKTKTKKSKDDAEPEKEQVEEEDAFDEQVFEDALAVALREYKEAVARGDFAAATLLAYRIFWLRAGWEGCVKESDTHTWRDALRMVRKTDTRRDVRELLPMVERVRYADHVPARTEFNDWSLKLERINPQGVM